ncbi:3-oxo-tetronate kinase [Gymnodinialimonas sp. 2305UL16-5]|uniref:3-oxo-tetronate kinase n=1 Tax=Gymnodinialimonas mytili TaxID=3126503 RepID=UPI00309B4552
MLIGVIADDFTGASDIANTLAKGISPEGGLRTAQFAGVPDRSAPGDVDAGVVSLKSRTAPKDAAVADSITALNWLLAQGCRQIVFKYCSTFDSTKGGNIGPVAEALADALDARRVIFCPAFPTTGRTVYQGHLFVGDQPLHESGMARHPLTPMTDPDIRRWLGHQTLEPVGHLPLMDVTKDPETIRQALERIGHRFVVADAISDQNLLDLGTVLADARLITGGSGIALGLPRNILRAGSVPARDPHFRPIVGPEAVLAGSCSGATRGQIDRHAKRHPTFAIDVPGVMRGDITANTLIDFYRAHEGNAPLAYSSGSPDDVRAFQTEFGRDQVADKLDALFAETAVQLAKHGYRRIVVAGGETSGAVAQALSGALGAPAMAIGPEIDPGVPILSLGSNNTVALALKSGNFGTPDFFAKALRMMEIGT